MKETVKTNPVTWPQLDDEWGNLELSTRADLESLIVIANILHSRMADDGSDIENVALAYAILRGLEGLDAMVSNKASEIAQKRAPLIRSGAVR